MIPTAIIQKALDGGYLHDTGVKIGNNQHDYVEFQGPMGFSKVTHSTLALSPSFWQALGEALGWGSFYDDEGMPRRHLPMLEGWYPITDTASGIDNQAWQAVALYFYDLILTGGDTTKFWSDLLANLPH